MGLYIPGADPYGQASLAGPSQTLLPVGDSMDIPPVAPPVALKPVSVKPSKSSKSQGGSQPTPQSLDRRRRMADALLGQGMDTSPIASPWQGAARLAQALVGGMSMNRADQQEQAGRDQANQSFMDAVNGGQMTPQALAGIISNPWSNEGQQSLAAKMWESQLPKPGEPFTLNEGDVRFDAQGNKLAEGKPKLADFTREYNAYVDTHQKMMEQGIVPPGTPPWTPEQYLSRKQAQTTLNLNDQKLTAEQSKDLYFYGHGSAANTQLSTMDDKLTELASAAAARGPQIITNYLKSPEYRQAERAGREYLAAILRKETGAAVTQQEFDYYGPMYLPQPGDDARTIAYKKDARTRAVQDLKYGLGNARDQADQIDKDLAARPPMMEPPPDPAQGGAIPQPQQQQSAPIAPPAPGEVRKGYRFNGGDPASPQSWEPVQ